MFWIVAKSIIPRDVLFYVLTFFPSPLILRVLNASFAFHVFKGDAEVDSKAKRFPNEVAIFGQTSPAREPRREEERNCIHSAVWAIFLSVIYCLRSFSSFRSRRPSRRLVRKFRSLFVGKCAWIHSTTIAHNSPISRRALFPSADSGERKGDVLNEFRTLLHSPSHSPKVNNK